MKIPRVSTPKQKSTPSPLPLSNREKQLVDEEVQKMLQKGAIICCNPVKNQFLSVSVQFLGFSIKIPEETRYFGGKTPKTEPILKTN